MNEKTHRTHDHTCPGGCGTRIDCDIIACERCFPAVLVLGPFATPQQISALVQAPASTTDAGRSSGDSSPDGGPMTKVRAKFHCYMVAPGYGESKTASLHAVYDAKGENADFAKATPAGSLNITIDGGTPAAHFFEQGKQYYLDFTPVEG